MDGLMFDALLAALILLIVAFGIGEDEDDEDWWP